MPRPRSAFAAPPTRRRPTAAPLARRPEREGRPAVGGRWSGSPRRERTRTTTAGLGAEGLSLSGLRRQGLGWILSLVLELLEHLGGPADRSALVGKPSPKHQGGEVELRPARDLPLELLKAGELGSSFPLVLPHLLDQGLAVHQPAEEHPQA